MHQLVSAPVMKGLCAWMTHKLEEKRIEPNSGMGQAFNYMLERWDKMTVFLRIPGAPIDSRVGGRRGGVQAALGCIRRFRLRARVELAITPSPAPASSNRTGGFPASGSPRRRLHIGVMVPLGRALAFAAL
jgi:hypothetical protein